MNLLQNRHFFFMVYYSSLARALKSFTGPRSPKNIKLYHNQLSKQKHKIKQIYIWNPMTSRLHLCKH